VDMKRVFSRRSVAICLLVCFCLLFFSASASAQLSNAPVFQQVFNKFQSAASSWSTSITRYASWLFWCLVAISMVWTFGMMALRRADLGEFAAEFVRFTIFTGFFWWLLSNGPKYALDIIKSLQQIGGEASGLGQQVQPGHIANMGFTIFFNAVQHMSVWSPVVSVAGLILSALIMIVVALIGANMLLLLCSAYLLAYAGVFFLGFGGSRWTSDIAINYYRKILEVGASLFAMILVVGIGQGFIDTYYSQMNQGQDMQFEDLGVFLVVAIILLFLVDKVPHLVCGIITGASLGHAGIGAFGAGAAIGAAGLAMGAMATSGAVAMAGVGHAFGGAQALKAAYQKAQAHQAADVGGGLGGISGAGQGGGPAGYGRGPLTRAMAPVIRGAASIGSHLARGTGKVALDGMRSRAGTTLTGKIAQAIKSHSAGGKGNGENFFGSIGPGKTKDS